MVCVTASKSLWLWLASEGTTREHPVGFLSPSALGAVLQFKPFLTEMPGPTP